MKSDAIADLFTDRTLQLSLKKDSILSNIVNAKKDTKKHPAISANDQTLYHLPNTLPDAMRG